jgi:hypothetical protein
MAHPKAATQDPESARLVDSKIEAFARSLESRGFTGQVSAGLGPNTTYPLSPRHGSKCSISFFRYPCFCWRSAPNATGSVAVRRRKCLGRSGGSMSRASSALLSEVSTGPGPPRLFIGPHSVPLLDLTLVVSRADEARLVHTHPTPSVPPRLACLCQPRAGAHPSDYER